MVRHVFKFAFVALLTFTMSGCGSDDETTPGDSSTTGTSSQNDTTASTGKETSTSQSTPEEAFNGFKSALEKDDWGTGLAYLTPESQDMMLGGMIFGASFAVGFSDDKAKQEAFEKLLKEHGVDMSEDDESEPPKGGPEEAMKAMVAGVKDKGACLSAVMSWVDKNLNEDKNGGSPADMIKKASIGEMKIEGDSATASMKIEGKQEGPPLAFTKVGSKWYVDMVASSKADGGPGGPGGPPE